MDASRLKLDAALPVRRKALGLNHADFPDHHQLIRSHIGDLLLPSI
jgi:hypothetical protein